MSVITDSMIIFVNFNPQKWLLKTPVNQSASSYLVVNNNILDKSNVVYLFPVLCT